MMLNAKNLPRQEFEDFSLVFPLHQTRTMTMYYPLATPATLPCSITMPEPWQPPGRLCPRAKAAIQIHLTIRAVAVFRLGR
jgi:hypothetical protein